MTDQQEQAVYWQREDGAALPGSQYVQVVVRAKLVPGWKYVQPWETDAMTEIGRSIVAAVDLVPGVADMSVGRYDLSVSAAYGWSPEVVGAEIVEAVRPLVEGSV